MMKHKLLPLLFIIPCLLVCLIPSVGMIFHPTNERIGNETVTAPPSISTEDGGFNSEFLPQAGTYFEKHFAFRPEAITLDAKLQASVFRVSNLDTVTVGTDGWLYYSATLDDYLGRETLTERQIRGVVHNLELVQEVVERQGGKFLFTVAPNKNTLYPDNMAYYFSKSASDTHNRDLLRAELSDGKLNYCDLFALFADQDEVLYLKQDSHWNNKGALLAYNAVLTQLGKEHDDYSSAEVVRSKNFCGDLAKMLYPAAQEPEFNYAYQLNETYTYETDFNSVEDPIIKTVNPAAQGSLFMYRDSFGNALLPYFANAYGKAYFTKAYPVNLKTGMLLQQPDTVIIEIAERNIGWFIEHPPIIEMPQRDLTFTVAKEPMDVTLTAEQSSYDMQTLTVSAVFDTSLTDKEDILYLSVTDASGTAHVYEAYNTADGCMIYLPADGFAGRPLDVDLIVGSGGVCTSVYHTSTEIITLSE